MRVGSVRALIMILAALATAGCPHTEPTGETTTPLSQTSTTPTTSTPTTNSPTTMVTSPTGTTSFTPPTPTDQSGP